MNRIVGLETEYGCLTSDFPGSQCAVARVRDWIFKEQRHGLIDVHQRDWDEPPGNGGFLFNGGRSYIDMGHLEYCTPECVNLLDVLRYDQAGDALLLQAVKTMRMDREVSFIRNNIDHYSGATFGCHENYLVRRAAPLTEPNVHSLLAFLTLRMIYTSAGRVGATLAAEARGELARPGLDSTFQMSQRADYINNDLFEWVQFNRAIINTRDEPLADARKYRRLHLLHGDTNVLPTSLLLKVGTTSLVLDLLEMNCLPKTALADAVVTFRNLSHQPDGPWVVHLANGKCVEAVHLLQEYQRAAHAALRGRDAETDILLTIWAETLEALGTDPERLVGKVDWITKRWLLSQFCAQESIPWSHPWLKSQDLEFHQIDPERSLGLALAQTPPAWEIDAADTARAMDAPPTNTRAAVRSHAMRQLQQAGCGYYIDWEIVGAEGGNSLHLLNPFDAACREADHWMHLIGENGKTARRSKASSGNSV
ncbi:MAG TPA: proteasome accessory factor PafA2 family protein [Verrucomicrobiae bacterium]|jgi:proteasome accessory factor A|nr:proteasome accessory factor PafA2 family protein [Verrucomicrobiae bacterium]